MKKVISILLAVATFAFAAPAFADVSISGSKNNMTTLPVASSGTLPIFRTGDTFTINLTGLTEGQLTLLTYKSSDGSSDTDIDDAFEDDNIQYIDQYTVDNTGELSIEYIVRSTEAGVYCIKINNGGNLTLTAYYRMGDVTVSSIGPNGVPSDGYTSYYYSDDIDYGNGYSLGFVGKATLAKGGTFEDAGVNLGFRLKGGKFGNEGYLWADAISGKRIDDYFDEVIDELGVELDGAYSVIYGLTVYNVPEADKNVITAKAESDVYAE